MTSYIPTQLHTSATHCSQLLLLRRTMNDLKYKVIQPFTIGYLIKLRSYFLWLI